MTSLVVTAMAVVVVAAPAVAQSLVGALAIDERRGDQHGWAVDFETAAAAEGMALQECGSGCSVVLTFGRCAAYAADQDATSTVVGWAESFASATGARQAALGRGREEAGGGDEQQEHEATAAETRRRHGERAPYHIEGRTPHGVAGPLVDSDGLIQFPPTRRTARPGKDGKDSTTGSLASTCWPRASSTGTR